MSAEIKSVGFSFVIELIHISASILLVLKYVSQFVNICGGPRVCRCWVGSGVSLQCRKNAFVIGSTPLSPLPVCLLLRPFGQLGVNSLGFVEDVTK